MNVVVEESLLRQIIREEFEAVIGGTLDTDDGVAGYAVPISARGVNVEGRHPYDMSDQELKFAESMFDDVDGEILRHRVTAFRLEAQGSIRHAKAHRRKADSLEKQKSARKAS